MENHIFEYAGVSSQEPNLDRQLKQYVPAEFILTESWKDLGKATFRKIFQREQIICLEVWVEKMKN